MATQGKRRVARLSVRQVLDDIMNDSDSEFSEVESDNDEDNANVQGDAGDGSDSDDGLDVQGPPDLQNPEVNDDEWVKSRGFDNYVQSKQCW